MIRDWEIPSVGTRRAAGALNRAWRRMQDNLLRGSPLLVDTKGNALTELRSPSAFRTTSEDWNELLNGTGDTTRIIQP